MKAKDLIKKSPSIEDIHNAIDEQNKNGCFKHFIPHWIFIPDNVKLKLIEEGFKVYVGNWDGIMTDVLIIEW